jgi:hypothetical protein
MKKVALKALTMLVSIIVLAFATAVATNAQSSGKKLRADIPFEFVVGDKTLAAGVYSVGQITTNSNEGIAIVSRDGQHSAMRLTNAVSTIAPMKKASLTFHRYGSTYFLTKVWMAGSAEGREMLKSKAERSVERELARNSSESNLAQNTQVEIVTIIAGID